jgi:hypothetical protein
MLRRSISTAWAAIAIVLVSTDCGDSTSVHPTVGAHYELSSYDSELPHTWRRIVSVGGSSFSCDDQITGGRLLFGSGTSVTEIIEDHLVCNDGTDAPSADTASGHYTQTGTHLDLLLTQGRLTREGLPPLEQSADLAGDVLTVNRTTSNSTVFTQTDFTVQVFTLVR